MYLPANSGPMKKILCVFVCVGGIS